MLKYLAAQTHQWSERYIKVVNVRGIVKIILSVALTS